MDLFFVVNHQSRQNPVNSTIGQKTTMTILKTINACVPEDRTRPYSFNSFFTSRFMNFSHDPSEETPPIINQPTTKAAYAHTRCLANSSRPESEIPNPIQKIAQKTKYTISSAMNSICLDSLLFISFLR